MKLRVKYNVWDSSLAVRTQVPELPDLLKRQPRCVSAGLE